MAFKPRTNIFSKLRGKDESFGAAKLLDDTTMHDSSNVSAIVSTGNESVNSETSILLPDKSILGGLANSTRDEHDLEITEIRDVSSPKRPYQAARCQQLALTKSEQEPEAINTHQSIIIDQQDSRLALNGGEKHRKNPTSNLSLVDDSASSNDVLLEAFNNTQRICLSLKKELQKQTGENDKLKESLKAFEDERKLLTSRFHIFKETLDTLAERNSSLVSQKSLDDVKVKDLKESLISLQKRIAKCRSDITTLSDTIEKLNKLKEQSDSELQKRNKELEYVRKQLNDCSGQLSEEKIKSNGFLQELTKLRQDLTNMLSIDLNKFHTMHYQDLDKWRKENLENMRAILDSQTGIICTKLDESTTPNIDQIRILIQDFVHDIFKEKNTSEIKMTGSLATLVERIEKRINCDGSNLKQLMNSVDSKVDCLKSDILASAEKCKQEFRLSADDGRLSIGSIYTKLEKFESEIRQSENLRNELDGLRIKYAELQQENKNTVTSLRKNDTDLKCFETEIQNNKTLLGMKEVKLKETQIKLEDAMKKLQEYEKDNLRKEETQKSSFSNYENKLTSQLEISKALTSENEVLKQTIKQLEDSKQQFEKEISRRLDKVHKVNDQLQKLNVEVVQLKAHELELEEENRSVRKMLDEGKLSINETSSEINDLKRQLIEIKAEKQDVIAENLDLRDKLEESLTSLQRYKRKKMKLTDSKYFNEDSDKCIYNDKLTDGKIEQIPLNQAIESSNQHNTEKLNSIKNGQFQENSKVSKHHHVMIADTNSKISQVVSSSVQSSSTVPNRELHERSQSDSKKESIRKTEVNSIISKDEETDEFDLSSSPNDDLELTNPSPIQIRPQKSDDRGVNRCMKPPNFPLRKKILLLDDEESIVKRKRRRK